ncbi:MAG: 2-polyprenyl-3-methyl-5-hydroxy-6-metoxy-1,4-benzoquinol methylase [Halieaceae bacterium]|jgi:2-polyprenyl-3-methyl-5-hydroxy-6-metoxy-1,4-benzoquinol methylase
MKDKYRQQWECLGKLDPYWAVLSDHSKRGGKWESAEFFHTGECEIAALMGRMKSLGLNINRKRALDFGCGVGRLTQALSEYFTQVLGVDISSSMLDEARRANATKANIKFLQNTDQNLALCADNSVDFIYSNIVLQHMPKERQLIFLSEFFRILAGGGTAVFQTPSGPNYRSWQGWVFRLLGYKNLNRIRKVIYGGPSGIMEIHACPQNEVIALLRDEGVELVQRDANFNTGKALTSYMYYVCKPV